MSPVFTGSPLVETAAGHYLQAVARDEAPGHGAPATPVDDTARRVWEIAFGLMVRRRFEPNCPLTDVSRSIGRAVHGQPGAVLPPLDAEMLVREELGEKVPADDIDPAVRIGVHLLLFGALADELALTDGELDSLIRQAEELAGEPGDACEDG